MVSRHTSLPRQVGIQDRPVQLVGRRVRRLRKERRLSLKQLAGAAGIQPADLARLEKGEYRASLDVLFRILMALEVNGAAFFAETAKEEESGYESNAIREL